MSAGSRIRALFATANHLALQFPDEHAENTTQMTLRVLDSFLA
jgi:hypothetical protein